MNRKQLGIITVSERKLITSETKTRTESSSMSEITMEAFKISNLQKEGRRRR